MNSNFERLRDLLLNCSNSFNIFCVIDTWLPNKDLKHNSNVHLPGFDLINQENLQKSVSCSNICSNAF